MIFAGVASQGPFLTHPEAACLWVPVAGGGAATGGQSYCLHPLLVWFPRNNWISTVRKRILVQVDLPWSHSESYDGEAEPWMLATEGEGRRKGGGGFPGALGMGKEQPMWSQEGPLSRGHGARGLNPDR